MKKIFTVLFSYLFVFTPILVFAADPKNSGKDGDLGEISSLFNSFTTFINSTLIPLVFAIALLVFLYGIFKYFILGGGDEESRKQGRQLMMYSIAGFVVMVSIFGIVNLVASGLNLNDENTKIDLPTAPTR